MERAMEFQEFYELVKAEYGQVKEPQVSAWYKYLVKYHSLDFDEKTATGYLAKKIRKATHIVREKTDDTAVAQIDTIVAKYLASYTEVTPNDRASFRQLATIEYQLGRLEEAVLSAQLMDIPELTKAQISLTSEHRQLQRTLGMDRRTREEEQGESDVVSRIEGIVEGAQTFYKERIVEVKCECGIKIGHILAHFLDWEFRGKCPRCGKEVVRTHLDMKVPPVI